MALWDDTPSDGVFRFYWADHEEFEYAAGPFDSVEDAWAHALNEAREKTYGPEPGSTIYIVECDKRTTVAPVFDTKAMAAQWRDGEAITFDIEHVLDLFMEANEDCWGEDGWDGLTGDAEAAETALIQGLQDAARAWMVEVGDNDDAEAGALQALLRAAVERWEQAHRDQIKTWLFGRMREPVRFTIPEMTPAEMVERAVLSMMRATGLSREHILALSEGLNSPSTE